MADWREIDARAFVRVSRGVAVTVPKRYTKVPGRDMRCTVCNRIVIDGETFFAQTVRTDGGWPPEFVVHYCETCAPSMPRIEEFRGDMKCPQPSGS